MVELPFDRLQEEPLFIYCRVDLFRSFAICGEQKELKCVIYIEVVRSLETGFFLLTLRKFIRRRANI